MKMEWTECSETSAYKIQTPGELTQKKAYVFKHVNLTLVFWNCMEMWDVHDVQTGFNIILNVNVKMC